MDQQPQDQQPKSQTEDSSQYPEAMIVKEESDNTKKPFSVGDALNFGWETFKKNYKFLLIFGLCYWGVIIAESIVKKIAEGNPAYWIVALAGFLLELLIGIGLIQVVLKISRGQKAQLKELFGGSKYLLNYFLGSIMYLFVVLVGFLLFIVPGFIWMIKYGAFQYLIIDKNLSPWEAMKESGKITYGYKKKLFLLGLAMILISIGGAMLFFVGLFVAIPVTLLSMVYAYRFMIGENV